MCIASNLVDPSAMTTEWEDIGGMEDIIEDIKETVILPFNCQKLCSGSMLLQPPKGRSTLMFDLLDLFIVQTMRGLVTKYI